MPSPTFVNATFGTTFGTNITVSTPSLSAGDTITVILSLSSSNVVTIQDGQGSYTNLVSNVAMTGATNVTIAQLTSAVSGVHAVTLSAALGANASFYMWVYVYTGGSNTGTIGYNFLGSPVSPFSAASITPAVNGSTVLGFFLDLDAVSQPLAASPFASESTASGGSYLALLEDYTQATAAAITPTCTFTGSPTNYLGISLALSTYAAANTATIAWIT